MPLMSTDSAAHSASNTSLNGALPNELTDRLKSLIENDEIIRGMRTTDGLSVNIAMQVSRVALKRKISVVQPKLNNLRAAEQERDEKVLRARSWAWLGPTLIYSSLFIMLAGIILTFFNGFFIFQPVM